MTSRWLFAAVASLLIVAARAEPQSAAPIALDQSMIRVESQGNELVAMREAPIAYSTLEQMSTNIAGTSATRTAPVRVVRTSPPQEIDYLPGLAFAAMFHQGAQIRAPATKIVVNVNDRHAGVFGTAFQPAELLRHRWRIPHQLPRFRELEIINDIDDQQSGFAFIGGAPVQITIFSRHSLSREQ